MSAQMKQQFFKAAEAALSDPKLQHRPVVNIETETFRQILKPIERVLGNDPVYGEYQMGIARQIEELRRMCLEAQAAHTTKDTCTKKTPRAVIKCTAGHFRERSGGC